MTDQRTLKKIINDQRAEIQTLQKEKEQIETNFIDALLNIDKLEKQVEAAKTILNSSECGDC